MGLMEPELLGLLAELLKVVATGQCCGWWSQWWLSLGVAVCVRRVRASPAVLQGGTHHCCFPVETGPGVGARAGVG